ncbi:MAG: sulfotransferase domain-containing protein [Anaerolineales bacterium]|nr:sulfotransferase domain-containing protein [Anaerolineales bacterium]
MKLNKLSEMVKALVSGFQNSNGRGNFYGSIRPSDSFLVTYPKSGTTWVGFALSNVINEKLKLDLNLRNFIEIVPDLNDAYFSKQPFKQYDHLNDPRILMTHAPYDPAFPKIIYVLRDPRDVFVSYWHHKRLTEAGFHLSLKDYLLADDHWPCSWDKHAGGWLLSGRTNVLTIRYEEMHSNAQATLRKIVNFIGLPDVSEAVLEKAITASRFDKMQKLEEQHGVDRSQGSKDERFIRQGRTGSWRNELDEECLQILEGKLGAVMERLGYLPETQTRFSGKVK